MFNSEPGKKIGDAIQWYATDIRGALTKAFEQSILNVNSEIVFFRNLLQRVKAELDGLSLPGISVACRTAETHQKPRVIVKNPRPFSCELSDLLVVVKYRQCQEIVEKCSVLYQVKLCSSGSQNCGIDQNQLELLSDWPTFDFGLLHNGGPRSYNLHPHSLEFGSYLLMLRAPQQGQYIRCHSHYCHWGSYGVAPHSLAVRRLGPTTVSVSDFPYALAGDEAFFGHIALDRGEHHALNPAIEELVAALYRHLGLDPDPPGEFDGYLGKPLENQPGFGILEILVQERDEGLEHTKIQEAKKRIPPKGTASSNENKGTR